MKKKEHQVVAFVVWTAYSDRLTHMLCVFAKHLQHMES